MTSTCSQSASGPTSPTASARPPKSADNRDGAIRSIAASLPAAFAIPGTVGFGTVRAEPFAGREPQTAYPQFGGRPRPVEAQLLGPQLLGVGGLALLGAAAVERADTRSEELDQQFGAHA